MREYIVWKPVIGNLFKVELPVEKRQVGERKTITAVNPRTFMTEQVNYVFSKTQAGYGWVKEG